MGGGGPLRSGMPDSDIVMAVGRKEEASKYKKRVEGSRGTTLGRLRMLT